jgi:NADH:ubiquinone oxidoreductase subunit F (NADH-binding)/Pyruvate/2-oxoacid:ferredoxin oxidoreductase delta subunit/(2Fe-2S) ferredoxin
MWASRDKLIEYTNELKGDTNLDNTVYIYVSMGTCGIAAGADVLYEALVKENKNSNIKIVKTGCMGLCYSEPTIATGTKLGKVDYIYGNVTPDKATLIIMFEGKEISNLNRIDKNWYCPEDEENTNNYLQARIALKNSGFIDPEDINNYILRDGYIALSNVLAEYTSEQVIDLIKESSLKGRGGGGFPTGLKWQLAANSDSDEKYVICNADEGDPGAFMDRAVLEGDPHALVEAMIVAGYAIGASHGVVYIRAEYPLAIERLGRAIDQAKEMGLLGKNILGSEFSFSLDIKLGAGAFVCGEETALIHSIEGKRGEPTFKPPYPSEAGLWQVPTIVNNVETYANVPAILRKGVDWYKKVGTKSSPGTKVFALAGKINKVGLVEVPMGTKIHDIIYKLGDGIKDGKKFKALQTGGPSGGCITEKNLDTSIDYDSLRALGSMMGSGGMIVMDQDDCMVNVAKYFLEFTLDESCGKCTPCRIGNKRLHEMLVDICDGKGTEETLIKLKDLSDTIKDTSLCGLGQASPNPILSTMTEFEDEYIAHVYDKSCPAGVCAKMVSYVINDKCIGCTLCARGCPVSCIAGNKKEKHAIDQNECIKCGVCFDVCKFNAIDKD